MIADSQYLGILDDRLLGQFMRDAVTPLEHRKRAQRPETAGDLRQAVLALADRLLKPPQQIERQFVQALLVFAELPSWIGKAFDQAVICLLELAQFGTHASLQLECSN